MPQKVEVLKLDADVLAVLRESTVRGNGLHLPPRTLERKLYVRVNAALELLGGEWNRGRKAHVFQDVPEMVIEDAISTGVVANHRKTFQFFETPPAVADRLVARSEIRSGMRVLEPSAGRGAILLAIHRRLAALRATDQAAGLTVDCCELWDENYRELRRLGFLPVCANFFDLDPSRLYDRIIANPPFSRRQDMEHVQRMASHLAPGGRCVAVMSPGWTFRQDQESVEFRRWVREDMDGFSWEVLPEGSFSASGTNVSAGVVVFERLPA